jgi:hypothetical protein
MPLKFNGPKVRAVAPLHQPSHGACLPLAKARYKFKWANKLSAMTNLGRFKGTMM